jgi:hypothetical protein
MWAAMEQKESRDDIEFANCKTKLKRSKKKHQEAICNIAQVCENLYCWRRRQMKFS